LQEQVFFHVVIMSGSKFW